MSLQPWMCLPFVLVLLSIAILHSFFPSFWKRYGAWTLSFLALPTVFLTIYLSSKLALRGFVDYVNFILVLGTLYKIGGGLYVSGTPKANPITNMGFMLGGALVANLIGTLGASMLFIRPLIRSNRGRKNSTHVFVFFIFIVSNCGGLLTPLGNPPLFYGFLAGIDFWWMLKLFPVWLFAITLLISIFVALDSYLFLKDPDFKGPLISEVKEPFKILGKWNIVLVGATVLALLAPELLPAHWGWWKMAVRVALLVGIIQLSTKLTPQQIHSSNNFSWEPFKEVALLFAAIFATMPITLEYLQQRAPFLEIDKTAWGFYMLTGALSSTFNNAPTFAAMLSVASGLEKNYPIIELVNNRSLDEIILMAICSASVFFGALTYIGNGPNFLIKAICGSEGIKMPTFLGYMLWSIFILLPVILVTGVLFFI
ncbi:MAG: sodium:proton antiporter [Oligoflexia bacterium]|nr:sodium:proton antiporter [Oligoflexia bacterium]